jgi:hypothetical protein
MTFEILPNAGDIDTQNGRCEAMVIDSGLPAYRCTRIAATDRKSRRVCEAHTRSLRIRFYDADQWSAASAAADHRDWLFSASCFPRYWACFDPSGLIWFPQWPNLNFVRSAT